jgi:hypothetical protein
LIGDLFLFEETPGGNMSEISSSKAVLPIPDEISALIAQASSIKTKIEENRKAFIETMENMLCPVCQDGYLYTSKRGKILGFISDKWLLCKKCDAEFDKKLTKATLVNAKIDPYDVFKNYKNKTLSMKEWKEIIQKRILSVDETYEKDLSAIKIMIGQYLFQQFLEKKFQLIAIDLNCFLLKKNEVPIFGTQAEVIEERKRKLTQRTTTGGGRRTYGGFSFRVVKGVYYHTGSSSAASPRQTTVQSTEYTELVSADNGDFLITNQRMLFKGNRSRGLAIPINKIAAIDIDSDENALMIVQENKKPSILKLQTKFTITLKDLEVGLSISLEDIPKLIRA